LRFKFITLRFILTTNIFDRVIPKLASDSRWSISINDSAGMQKFICYIDDSGCDKIISVNGISYMFAGNAALIQKWKDWLLSNPNSSKDMPDMEDSNNPTQINIAICAVNEITHKIEIECRQVNKLPDVISTGTGGEFALECWKINKDPCKAVNSAIQKDPYSGGAVKFINLLDNSHNLQNNASFIDIINLMREEGFIMYSSKQSSPIRVAEAAKNDSDVLDLVNNLASGNANICAPYPGMDTPWSDEEKVELKTSFDRIFSTKNHIK